jgi:hypothetical protein
MALRTLSVLVVLCVAFAGGCATYSQSSPSTQATMKVPANYHQVVARYIAELKAKSVTKSKITKAEITRPGLGFNGIFSGGDRPMVCARVTYQTEYGSVSSRAAYAFSNGQIESVIYPDAFNPSSGAFGNLIKSATTCDRLTYGPFPEMLKVR